MKLRVVTVNYRTADTTIRAIERALADLAAASDPASMSAPISGAMSGGLGALDTAITVVDNASGDGSLERLRAAAEQNTLGSRVTILDAGTNGGFGAGNNLAIRAALDSDDPPEYIYLLNPDAFVHPGAMAAIVAFMDAHPDVGIAGTRIYDEDGRIHPSAFRFPTVMSELERGLKLGLATRLLERWVVWKGMPDGTGPVEWVSGASCVLRRRLLEEVGLFDEGFFLYFEETDLCRRAHAAGWEVWFLAEASVTHMEGASTGIKERRRIPGYWLDSRRRYFKKAGGTRTLLLANAAWAAAFAAWRARRAIQRKPDDDPPYALRDFLRHSLGLARLPEDRR
jgi:N-acetylglucosaminyl-diphospho-decaprenol L-rhamnosyltransferase